MSFLFVLLHHILHHTHGLLLEQLDRPHSLQVLIVVSYTCATLLTSYELPLSSQNNGHYSSYNMFFGRDHRCIFSTGIRSFMQNLLHLFLMHEPDKCIYNVGHRFVKIRILAICSKEWFFH